MLGFLQCADNVCRLGDNGSHMSCLTMLQEQLDAVRDQLMSDNYDDLRQSIYCAFLEDAERGANMIIAFAKEKGLKFDAKVEDVVQAMNTMDDEDIDIEMTPEMLASVSGSIFKCGNK